MSKEQYVYLCGPMAANTPEQAAGWRNRAFELLTPHGITVISPMREKDMLVQGTVMGVDYTMYGEVPELRAQSIYARDTFDVSHADFILANFTDLGVAESGEPIPSLGSDWEMGYAAALGKRIVLVAPPDSYYRKHPFPLAGSSIQFDTLEEGCFWIIKNFQPYRSPGFPQWIINNPAPAAGAPPNGIINLLPGNLIPLNPND